MTLAADSSSATPPDTSRAAGLLLLLVALAAGALWLVFGDGLSLMVRWWEREEYSHGYMIPLVAAFLIWQKLPLVGRTPLSPSWWAVPAMLLAIFAWSLGEMSALYTIVQYAFLLALYALVVSQLGWRGAWILWAGLAYLIFMIPLPNFLYFNLSQKLQLISSELGVAVVRLFGVSVYLEGNVIDLGTYQLQVVEACSGLRYLFPLMSFGFLVAAIYRGPLWHRVVIFLSTIPITILMNSFRIGVIGVMVNYWGTAMAEGFLHDFEGWIVFMACLAVLLAEIWLLNLLSRDGTSLWDRLDLSSPTLQQVRSAWAEGPNRIVAGRPFVAAVVLLLLAVPFSYMVSGREDAEPPRRSFAAFPLIHQGWMGRERALDAPVLEELKLTDYITAQYRRSDAGLPVDFYVAYYAGQRKGASIHSPKSCLPGGGWVIKDFSQQQWAPQNVSGAQAVRYNRAVIQQGENRMLVYYWFDQRGRNITNEYAAKWYIFWDALTTNRTDGALVRLITAVPAGEDIAAADARLQRFMGDFTPLLSRYIPGRNP